MLCYGKGGKRKDGIKKDSPFSGKTNLMMIFTGNGNTSGRINSEEVESGTVVSYFKYAEFEALIIKHFNRDAVQIV